MISRGTPVVPHFSAGTRWVNADLEAGLQLEASPMYNLDDELRRPELPLPTAPNTAFYIIHCMHNILWGHAVAQLVEALRYKLEGFWFDSRCCHCNFPLT